MIPLIARRDSQTIERLFYENCDWLYTFVYYRVGKNRETTADVVQETFLTALCRFEEYNPKQGDTAVWLAWLAKNHIRNALRERGHCSGGSDLWEQIDARILRAFRNLDSEPLPEEAVERRETADLVRLAFAKIPSRYQEALNQRYWEHQSIEEMARCNGKTEGAVKSMLHRARQAFQTAFIAILKVREDLQSAKEEGKP